MVIIKRLGSDCLIDEGIYSEFARGTAKIYENPYSELLVSILSSKIRCDITVGRPT